MDLEAKSMKLEEKMKGLENERCKEDRDFQFRLFSMMCHGSHYQSPTMNYASSMVPRPFDTSGSSSAQHYSSPLRHWIWLINSDYFIGYFPVSS